MTVLLVIFNLSRCPMRNAAAFAASATLPAIRNSFSTFTLREVNTYLHETQRKY